MFKSDMNAMLMLCGMTVIRTIFINFFVYRIEPPGSFEMPSRDLLHCLTNYTGFFFTTNLRLLSTP